MTLLTASYSRHFKSLTSRSILEVKSASRSGGDPCAAYRIVPSLDSVNASNVVATTSFAGFAEAGTTIEVTPHISNDDYLQLEYRVMLNSFTGSGSDGIPPPRKTNEVSSVVTIPDGHTVIVGGLNQKRRTQNVQSIPWIEKIPVVKHLASRDIQMQANSTLFLFLRPVILRDDKFGKLKFYSEQAADRAGDNRDYPVNGPVLMR